MYEEYHCPRCGAYASLVKGRCVFCGYEKTIVTPVVNEQCTRSNTDSRLLAICGIMAEMFHKTLLSKSGKSGMEYILARGVSTNMLEAFQIGYAGRFPYARQLLRLGFTREELVNSGIFRDTGKDLPSCLFYGRVVFPIRKESGEVIAFGGRSIDGNGAKYVNSPETAIFHKRETLYGEEFATRSKAMAVGQPAILCEGYMDVIAMQEAGFRSAMASLGTALTTENAKRIADRFGSAILLYDTDEPGQMATLRAGTLLEKVGVTVYVADTGVCKDPDELIRKSGSEAMKDRFLLRETFPEWRMRKAVLSNDRNGILNLLLEGSVDLNCLRKYRTLKK